MSRSELKTQIMNLLDNIKNTGRYGNTERSVLSNCCEEELQRAGIPNSYRQFESELNDGKIDELDLQAIRNRLRQISEMNGGKRKRRKPRKTRKTRKSRKTRKTRKTRKSRKTRRH